jgi:hypothetical protein
VSSLLLGGLSMTELSDLLRTSNKAGHSARAIAKLAQEKDFTLNHDTAARYLRGDHGKPDEPTLMAFASVLSISLQQLRKAASLPSEEVQPYTPPPESSRLTRRQRRAVDEVIRAMLQTPAGAEVVELKRRKPAEAPAGTVRGIRAARRGKAEPPD